MAEFINFEAEHSDDSESEMSESNMSEMNSFINDESDESDNENLGFANMEFSLEEANRRIHDEAFERIQDCDDYSNLCAESNEDESSIFEFDRSETYIEKFKNDLLPKTDQKNEHNNFTRVILYKTRNLLENKTDVCDTITLKQNPTLNQILEQFSSQDLKFSLDLQEYNRICYQINEILVEYSYFLRVFEQKNKYRQFYIKSQDKQKQMKQLASCLIEKYNGFQVIKVDFNKKQRRNFQPIDIIYIPTKNAQILPECYYTIDISKAYTWLYSKGLKTSRSFLAYECYYCKKFFLKKVKHETHMKVCTGKPDSVYNFCTQTVTLFEDNFGSKGDLPFAIYFETTSPTDAEWLNPENKKMFVMSYVMVVAFHPHFDNLEQILIQRSFSHSKEQLTSISYLTREQFEFKPPELIKQLYDQALHVSKRKCKNSLAQMFCIEVAFVKKTLLSWFNKKIAQQFKQLSQDNILKFQREHPLDYRNGKCVICKTPIMVSPQNPNPAMTYEDFIIRYEYKFIQNIYTQKQLEWSDDLKSLDAYYKSFQTFIPFSIDLNRLLSNYIKIRLRDISMEVRSFLETNFADCDIECIKNQIMQTDIKNALSASEGTVPKFNLKIYAYLYDELIFFPPQSLYDVLTTKKIFKHVHNLIKMKVNIHNSHITGKIIGYTHDFCNLKVQELEKSEIPCIAHKLFGFDFFYFMKGFSTTAWRSKELSVGGTNLTPLNFASIRGEIKFIDSIKYHQRSLAELTSSMEEIEIEKSRTQMKSFLSTHPYFSTVWPFIPLNKKEKILKITCEGKGVIPYEIITDMKSFFLQPENDFWSKTEFYSELKQKAVGDDEYEDSKFL